MACSSLSVQQQFLEEIFGHAFWIEVDIHKNSYRIAISSCIPAMVVEPSHFPRHIFRGANKDRLDFITLAEYGAKGMVISIAIPTPKQEAERMLSRQRHYLVDMFTKCKPGVKGKILVPDMTEFQEINNWARKSGDILLTLPVNEIRVIDTKIEKIIHGYLKHLKVIGRARETIRGAKHGLRDFQRFLQKMNVVNLADLNKEILKEYQQELAFRLTAKGTRLAVRSQAQLLGVVKGFCRYLKAEDFLLVDPDEAIILPKKPKSLPKAILDTTEIKKLLQAPDMQTNKGNRDRIVLEVLYDTGVRAAEMAAVKVRDLDLANGYLTVRQGKGAKDRVVSLSSRVCGLVREYVLIVRPELLRGDDDGALVVNRWGRQMTPMAVWAIVKKCAEVAGINKHVSTHTFRHTCATHMLKNGAPIRHIQELLGHESLESTQIYTRVTINDLKEVHAKYHPGESL